MMTGSRSKTTALYRVAEEESVEKEACVGNVWSGWHFCFTCDELAKKTHSSKRFNGMMLFFVRM